MATQQELKAKLESERQRLQTELRDLAAEEEPTRDARLAREQTGYGNHMADDATQTFEDEKQLAIEQHLRGMLDEVERALHRMAEGTYGRCENCGQEIDPARLEALPWTTLCLRCKTVLESRR